MNNANTKIIKTSIAKKMLLSELLILTGMADSKYAAEMLVEEGIRIDGYKMDHLHFYFGLKFTRKSVLDGKTHTIRLSNGQTCEFKVRRKV